MTAPQPYDPQGQAQYGGGYPPPPMPPGPVHVNVPRQLASEERRAVLAQAVQRHVIGGGRVQSQTDRDAVILYGKKPNHVLHLILTLITFFMWGFVWLLLAAVQRETRTLVSVDDFGNVLEQKA